MNITLTSTEEAALRDALHDWSHMAVAWIVQGDEHVKETYRDLEGLMLSLRVHPKLMSSHA